MRPPYITTADAAQRLGYTVQHVRRLAREGKLEGQKHGRDWLLLESSVARHAVRREFLDLPLEPPHLEHGERA